MRKFVFDQYEFDPPDSEQEVEVLISATKDRQHATLEKFADDVCGEGAGRRLRGPVAFSKSSSFEERREHLKRVASIDVADDCAWPCYIAVDEWNERQILLDAGNAFISYRWSTSA